MQLLGVRVYWTIKVAMAEGIVSRSQTLSAKARESLVNCPYKTCSSHPPKNGGC